jgi:hypothetical protein
MLSTISSTASAFLVTDDLAAAADMDIGTKLQEARCHGFAEPGASTRDEDPPAGQEIFCKHGSFPSKGWSVNWSID